MKFGELEEGKKYKIFDDDEVIYEKKDGGLFIPFLNTYSEGRMRYIMEVKFEEIEVSHDFADALEHMEDKTKTAEFDGFIFRFTHQLEVFATNLGFFPANVTVEMAKSKEWKLIG